ncbi:ScbR family autoregulator-binding transcription factor [Streptomyces subrutilus]|uniref:TetR/AcrR family transcriptional regulator n=1 Tax=Streptomyces subrutilus TaxID=36818 RepID=A0A5P2UZ34_9ACTN|nr:ScbR family autoregulator-binding transcription factor [Streptomyces subrutilus]QEU82614.1 TetR/AcrR family transcriptional regulator [Streptomyces subrutilus]QEU83355.1 TetR/AcrR family transcriptional regulator [Streptomyces subrutilus]WSJ27931.1 TetR/AcrR family transcriptional regulator [Streptomyces subrutilus]
MARQERAVRTRRVILEAAAAVFDERGYDAATIADILSRAGVTKGALYFHFASKQELAQGVLDEQFGEGGVPQRESKLQELVDVAMLLAYRMKREPMLSAGARLSLGPGMREIFGGGSVPGWIEFTRTLLVRAKEQGELLVHVDPAETAWILSACWTGAQIYSQALNDRTDVEERVAAVYQHICPSIATPAMLARLDMAPDRGQRVAAELESGRGPVREADPAFS